ncbi:MAG: hypothetical protein KJ069_29075 [Anaerolineae bacterium]|nr:hypothetical protein [Anaerolineae bacterium]
MTKLASMGKAWQKIDANAGYYLTWHFRAAHEGCHYAAARLLGLPARLQISRGYVAYTAPHPHDWRIRAAILAPALAGCVSLAVLTWLCLVKATWGLFWLGLVLHLFWWFICLADFSDLWHYYRHRRWPVPQSPPRQTTVETWLLAQAWRWRQRRR